MRNVMEEKCTAQYIWSNIHRIEMERRRTMFFFSSLIFFLI
uniref:Uncharacterized protein n=1 Tax=Lepeophtheirus salmonis TaxID=72036 RepID=A0A0K2VEG8_LEPSM